MTAHNWKPSTLGHGESVCVFCHGTNREIAVIGDMNVCPKAPGAKFDPTEEDIGRPVIYTSWDGRSERGVLTSIGGTDACFVRYGPTGLGISTKKTQLKWET